MPAAATRERVETGARIPCAWCGSPIDALTQRRGAIAICAGCGVGNTFPPPTEEELSAAYAGWYRPSGGRFSGFGDAILRRTRSRLAKRLDKIAAPQCILDVGAGDGTLLDALAARGRAAIGLEREASRADIRSGDLGSLDGEWGAIVFWHSLEHLANAGQELERAASLLAHGGVLVIAVPNADSLQARLFGERWLALDLPRHLVHLPAPALIERLQRLSLTVERVSYWRGGQVLFGWLHGIVGVLPGRMSLYDAIRRPQAQQQRQSTTRRLSTLAVAALVSPAAMAAATFEIAIGRGGTVYVEARRG